MISHAIPPQFLANGTFAHPLIVPMMASTRRDARRRSLYHASTELFLRRNPEAAAMSIHARTPMSTTRSRLPFPSQLPGILDSENGRKGRRDP